MTSRKLAPAVAAAALLLAAPSAALAARHPRAHRRATALSGCKLTITVEPGKVTSGDETPQLFGKLACAAGVETAGQTVTIYASATRHLGTVLGTATTVTGGFYTFIAPAPATNTLYYASAAGATSRARTVRVAPQVTLSGPSESKALFTGRSNRVAFAGTVSPAAAGATLLLQRESSTADEEWRPIQTGIVGPGGAYSLVHTFVIPGDANIRVLVRTHGRYTVNGASSPLSYVITQKELPQLTLFATSTGVSSDPISFGQSVTLEGTVAGGASKTVNLLARTAGGAFTTAGTQTADPSGHYSFQMSPQQDTAYKVISVVGTHSAILFEGVKYTLTAASTASSLQDGQTLSFSGTVTPYRAGHEIYLERQNGAGTGGFHVVAVAMPQAAEPGQPASYTISHVVFGLGKQVYRVKVPGDPDNQGVASAPFTVEVTSAPPGSLQPGAQTPLPGEGTL